LAGVSYQTVSSVINNKPIVADETRQRILEAIKQLNYTPDAAARSLRSGQSRIIGLMIPDAHNPHFWATISGAEDEAQANGYSLLLATTSMDEEREKNVFRAFLHQRMDAIIPLFTYPENFTDELIELKRKHIPFAISASGAAMPAIEMDIVWAHFEYAARELMDHLLGLGHTRIAIIHGVGRTGLASDRLTTYKQCLEQAGIPYNERYVVQCGYTLDDGYHAAEKLLGLEIPPTAIIGINDLMAFGAMQAALQHGLRIPEDVSIAGFDDLPMSSLLSPPLTTGRADGAEIGRQCVRMVLARLKKPDLPPQHIHLQTRLVVRASTGVCPLGQVSSLSKKVGAV
jgi:DNA-binding LacI/PurR family transcriptional regulator